MRGLVSRDRVETRHPHRAGAIAQRQVSAPGCAPVASNPSAYTLIARTGVARILKVGRKQRLARRQFRPPDRQGGPNGRAGVRRG